MAQSRRRNVILITIATLPALAIALVVALACNSKTPPSITPPEAAGPPLPVLQPGPDFFEDVTEKSGINFSYRNGEDDGYFAILSSLGGGGGLIDFDGDGKLDIFIPGGGYYDPPMSEFKKEIRKIFNVPFDPSDPDNLKPENKKFAEEMDRAIKRYWTEEVKKPDCKLAPPKIHGHPCRLYRNLGDFRFEDVTEKVFGPAKDQPDLFTHGCAVCDYDRDGWSDLLVTGYGRVILYHNEPDGKGGRKFVDRTKEAGLLGSHPEQLSKEAGQPGEHFWSSSAAFCDLDGDGWADLYLCQYVNWSWYNNPFCGGYTSKVKQDVCPPKQFDSEPHAIWRNKGDGTFENVTQTCGLRIKPRPDKDYGKGLGVVIGDVDGDGRPDIHIANDTTDHFLYMNKSTPGKILLEEKGLSLGVARDHNGTPNGGMGTWMADWDGCGRPSIWVTNYESEYHGLYRSLLHNNRISFTFHTMAAGLTIIGPNFVGFGTGFLDFDHDGWEDIAITNGHVIHYPARDNLRQRPILFLNVPRETKKGPERFFVDASSRGGSYFQTDHRGRGLALGDLNNDGKTDLVFINCDEPVRIMRNVSQDNNHWLGVELVAKDHRHLAGAKLTLEVGDRKLDRYLLGGGSYLSAHDMRMVFGLGQETKVGKLTVDWPSGEPKRQTFEAKDLSIDKYNKLEQK
jgi:hypothetical protein